LSSGCVSEASGSRGPYCSPSPHQLAPESRVTGTA
jgi:hypothetical protein